MYNVFFFKDAAVMRPESRYEITSLLEMLKENKGFAPLLLLDDVFEKLDEDRIGNLLHKVCIENEGQVFITDTHADRLQSHLDGLSTQYQLIDV